MSYTIMRNKVELIQIAESSLLLLQGRNHAHRSVGLD